MWRPKEWTGSEGLDQWMRNVDASKAQSYPSIRDFRTESGNGVSVAMEL